MTHPYLTIDLEKIEHNARRIAELCRTHGIEVAGVTKATCGDPEVARAMLLGGCTMIGDSRLENIQRLRAAEVAAPMLLLRVPELSEADEVVRLADISLNSELAVLSALSEAALARDTPHEVIIMVDLGDLREGVWPDRLVPFVAEAVKLKGIRIVGLGTNLACFGGVVPTRERMERLVALAREVERRFGLPPRWISGINSSGLELLASGDTPRAVNHARIGEAILLGRETIHRHPWPGTVQDAFALHAEVIELKEKPSVPLGERGEDAFGHHPQFEEHGTRLRAALDVGREDVVVEGLTPVDARLRILGGSSDYLIVDATAARDALKVGDRLPFTLNYAALLAAMTSAYIEKRPQ